jgi:hypothetical protein
MVLRLHLPSSTSYLVSSVIFASWLLIFPAAFGQAVLDKTTFGHSQNDSRDLENSLIVPHRVHIGKENKEEVDPRKLPSKTVKDTTFQGSLLNIGLPAEDTKLDLEKKPDGDDKKVSKSAQADSEKQKVSKQDGATSNKEPSAKSTDGSGGGQSKEQKATSAAAEEKSSGNATAKASASKPDGDH